MGGDISWYHFLGPIALGALVVWLIESNKRLDTVARSRPYLDALCEDLAPLLDRCATVVETVDTSPQSTKIEVLEVIMTQVLSKIEAARLNGLDTSQPHLAWVGQLEGAASAFRDFLIYGFAGFGDKEASAIAARFSECFARAQRKCRRRLARRPVPR